MSYAVKELFYTLQGEGAQAGRASVFCRFAGCNLWNGVEAHRSTATCRFCDTDFVGTDGPGGGNFKEAKDLAERILKTWRPVGRRKTRPLVVFTGGEPLLQLNQTLIDRVHEVGFEIAVETNGTQLAPNGIDWTCVSPKAGSTLILDRGNELKLVYPQEGAEPEKYASLNFEHFFLQPMDGPDLDLNTKRAVEYCLNHPNWRVSLQTHKFLGIP